MACVQIVEMHAKNDEDLQALGDEFFAAIEGNGTLQRSFVTLGRNDPNRDLILGFVDSHESAMEHSNLPETAAFAENADAAAGGAPPFYDSDVIEDRT